MQWLHSSKLSSRLAPWGRAALRDAGQTIASKSAMNASISLRAASAFL